MRLPSLPGPVGRTQDAGDRRKRATGTATGAALSTHDGVSSHSYAAVSTAHTASVSGLLRVTVGGTLILQLSGNSTGSDWTIQPTDAQITALVLKDG